MTPSPDPSPHAIADLLERLGRAAGQRSGFACGLNPAQWAALRYFGRANQFSRTVSAFARYHATTQGTASQTVKALEAKGLVRRVPVPSDRRSARIELTDSAARVLAEDPFLDVARVAGDIEPLARQVVTAALGRMLAALDGGDGPTFRRCEACRHLRRCDDPDPAGHRCALVDEPVLESELESLCVNFAPAPGG